MGMIGWCDMKRLKFICLLLLLLIVPNHVLAVNEVNVYLFYQDSCDICKQEKIYLEALKERYPNMRVYSYEVGDSSNYEMMQKAKNLYQETRSGVPFTVIGDSSYLGFSQNNKALFQKKVYEYSKTKYENKLGNLLGISYRNDLEGEVKEYTKNDDYKIEETSGKPNTTTTNKKSGYDKYKVSIYLIASGVILAIVAYFIHILEKRGRI